MRAVCGATLPVSTFLFTLLSMALAAAPAQAGELPVKPTVADIVQASTSADWRTLDDDNTLYMELPGGRVVIELAPPFAPQHAANIKALVREQYFDGLAVVRSQDNYVVQWGDPNEASPRPIKAAKSTLKAEFTVPLTTIPHFTQLKDRDGFAPQVGHWNGFPAARDPRSRSAWLTHCYGMVGVGRDNDADSGSGASLYVVTGHAPRHLDRNITVVGRVVSGMPLLSTLPRGSKPLGFYDAGETMAPIASIKVAADVPLAQRSRFDVMRTDSATYQKVIEAQRNRGGPWVKVAAGYIDLCNAAIPVRPRK